MGDRRVPQVADVWRDRDPRGGPTFVIIGFTPDDQYAWVESTTGSPRRRKVMKARLGRHYEFLRNEMGDET